MDVAAQVRRIIAEQALLPIEAVTMVASPAALGLDSLGLVEAIFAIEETFDISVPFNANDLGPSEFDMSTVQSLVDAVQALIDAKAT